MMRRIWMFAVPAVVLAVVLSIGAGRAFSEDDSAKQPRMEVAPMTFDFGTVDEGEKPKAVFTIKNTGTAELDIYDARPSCGCTVASLSSKKLAPGEQATLEAVFNSQNANGQVHKFVEVRTNDPRNQAISLTITGTVKAQPAPDIMLSAYNVTNLQLAAGGSTTRSITVTNTGQLDLVINEVTVSAGASASIDRFSIPSGQTTKMDLTLKPGESKALDITVSPKAAAGSFQETVTIRSNSKRRSAVTFIAQGIVQG